VGMVVTLAAGCGDDDETTGMTETPDVPDEVTPEPDVADVADPPDVSAPEDVGDEDTASGDTAGQAADEPDAGDNTTGPDTIAGQCFPDKLDGTGELPGPEYDEYNPIVGEHCKGTNHQAITGIQQVVFLGDSVTVGTPNLEHLLNVDNEHFWRNKLADWLALEFDLDKGDPLVSWGFWKTYDYFTGKGGKLDSGVFRNCSKWGARTDDLAGQIEECLRGGASDQVTLFVFTMGGNDIAKINQTGFEAGPEEVAAGYPAVWALAQKAITFLEAAVVHLRSADNFPNGSFVVMANPFEFTDGSGTVSACTPQTVLDIPGIGELDLSTLDIAVAELAGYGPWENPEIQTEIVVWLLEEYMRIAVDYQVDLVWMLEHFCGHGFVATGADADVDNRCYIGEAAPLWFDDTCTHPNEAGHQAIFELFKDVISE
jgi:lysophospholipase L1-like esterase